MKMIKGKTLEQQMQSVDGYLASWNRRIPKTIAGVITPFPISGYENNPADKVVLRYMFPVGGKITIGGAFFDTMPKDGVDIYLNIHRGDAINSTSVFVNTKTIIVNPNADVIAGDRVVISVVPKGPGEITGVWTSFLWVPEVKVADVKNFLIEELEALEEETE